MNKLIKTILAICGGIDVTFYMFTPMILSAIWITIVNYSDLTASIILILSGIATAFRAYKIGWMNK